MKKSSANRWLILFALVLICASAGYGQRRRGAGAKKPPSAPSQLTGMKLLPYNAATDSFGEDLATSNQALFNDLDTSVLVKIEVSGKAGDYADRNVEITAREGNKLVLNKTAMVGVFNESGKYYVTAWIYNPLCSTTTVQARLLGQQKPSVIKKTIQANCGE